MLKKPQLWCKQYSLEMCDKTKFGSN